LGQDLGDDVDDLTLESISNTVTRLEWTGPLSVDCEKVVTYSVYRGMTEDFTPSIRNRVVTGLTRTWYVATEPLSDKDSFYMVKAQATLVSCALHTGEIIVSPMDLGQEFVVKVGRQTFTCTARSTSILDCPDPLFEFHAVIATQGKHDYLIGCKSEDYESGAWTCANLTPSTYRIWVHSQTLTVLNSGFDKINARTGKRLSAITPVFSVLGLTK